MSSDFKVGDEVVCINVDPLDHTQFPENLNRLTLGAVYTIARIDLSLTNKIPIVSVAEIWQAGASCWWEAARFRKVEKKFTGMDTLRGLLKTKELVDG